MSPPKSSKTKTYENPQRVLDQLILNRKEYGKYSGKEGENEDGLQTKAEILVGILEFVNKIKDINLPADFPELSEDISLLIKQVLDDANTLSPQPYPISPDKDFTDSAAFALRALALAYQYLKSTGQLDKVNQDDLRKAIIDRTLPILESLCNSTGKGADKKNSWGAVKDYSGSIYFTWSAVAALSRVSQSGILSISKEAELKIILRQTANWVGEQYKENSGFQISEDQTFYDISVDAYALLTILNINHFGITLEKLDQSRDGAIQKFLTNQDLIKKEPKSLRLYSEPSGKGRGAKSGEEYLDESTKFVYASALFHWVLEKPELYYNKKNMERLKKVADKYLQMNDLPSQTHVLQRLLSSIAAYWQINSLETIQVNQLEIIAATRKLIIDPEIANPFAVVLFSKLNSK